MSQLTRKVVVSHLIELNAMTCLGEIFPPAYKKFYSTEAALVKENNHLILEIDRNKTVIVNPGR